MPAFWRTAIPRRELKQRLSNVDLTKISKHLLRWPDKARILGLTESEVEDIREDYRNSNELQKSAMMRRWGEKNGGRANLKVLLAIAERHGWTEFIRDVCKERGYVGTYMQFYRFSL